MDLMNTLDTTNVKTMTAREAKQSFGQLLDTAQREPVSITRNGRDVAVVLSKQDYERLEAAENAYWANQAQKAEQDGYLGADESIARLTSYMNETD